MKARHWIWGTLFFLTSVSINAGTDSLNSPSKTDALASPSQIHSSSFLSNFTEAKLIDQNGAAFEVHELLDHVVLFNFIFTSCGSVCPVQTKVLAEILGELPMDVRTQVRFVSVTVDPENDSPEQLRIFAKAFKADVNGWDFLTGNSADIKALTKRLMIFNEGQEGEPEVHRSSLWLVDKKGRMLQRYRGDPPDKERLIREIIQVSKLKARSN